MRSWAGISGIAVLVAGGLGSSCGGGDSGRTSSGGVVGTGGSVRTGGVTGAGGVSTGGRTGDGGATAATGTGGATASPGTTAVGGNTSVAGAKGTGGGTGAGGITASGGATGKGGSGGIGGSTGALCGGLLGVACASSNQVCETAPGHCCCDFQGTCATRPDACTADWRPVCGCDGKTYSNDCTRLSAGISKDHDGECQHPVVDAAVKPDVPADAAPDQPVGMMVPTLPAPCKTNADCCLSMDGCMAKAYLVGKAEYSEMEGWISSLTRTACVACVLPAVQVQCQAGFCTGELLPFYADGTAFARSHCGTISFADASVADAGVRAALYTSVDAGTPSVWSCASY